MFYPEEIIERVRQGNDIVDVISSHVKIKKAGSSYTGLCPFHSEKTPSFSVSRQKQFYHCFGCGKSGNVITFLMEYEGLGFQDALKQLAQRAGIELPEAEQSPERQRQAAFREKMFEVNKEAAKYYVYRLRQEKRALDYFQGRKLEEKTIRSFGLGYAPIARNELYLYLKSKGFSDDVIKECGLIRIDEKNGARDYFWNRIMFPIMDVNSRVIAFGGRVFSDGQSGQPKYLNSPETKIFDKSRNLYGLFLAKKSKRKEMLLCEGYMDVIALHQAGFDNAVASLGTALTPRQVGMIRRYTDTVLLTYDSDGAGKKAALRAIPMIREAGLAVRVVNMEPYKDPDEFIKNLGAGEYEKRLADAKNGFYFETDCLEAEYDLGDPEQKTRFLHGVAEKLLNFEEDLERNTYLSAVAKRYRIDEADLRKVVASTAMKLAGRKIINVEKMETRDTGKQKKKSAHEEAQSLFFSMVAEDAAFFERFGLTKDDFYGEPYRKVAELVFTQYEELGRVEPATILDSFGDIEEHDCVSQMFFHEVAGYRQMTDKQREWLVSDIYKKIREYSTREKQKAELIFSQTEQKLNENELFRQMIEGKKKEQDLQKRKKQ